MRDDFTKQTITEIAKGVGYRCSNPECGRATIGADAAEDDIITIGVAAHICAASRGGPRYDPVQIREARRAKENRICLCQNSLVPAHVIGSLDFSRIAGAGFCRFF